MDKSEGKTSKKSSKKRKHPESHEDEELELERNKQSKNDNADSTSENISKLSGKVKIKNKQKHQQSTNDNNDDDDDDDEQIHEPTHAEILESLKPENCLNIETRRQKKREKHKKNLEAKLSNRGEREMDRNAEYLRQWLADRNAWKFEKLRQISIQNHLFDEQMDNDIWPIALEYLSATKGAARTVIVQKAEEMIRKLDATINGQNDNETIDSINYERARELLQIMQ